MGQWVIYWIKGFLEIKIQGDYVERFMNMCRVHGIILWQIRKEEHDYFCRISYVDFFELPELIKKTKTKVYVLKKHGFIFMLPFFKKRVLFFIGLFLCLFALCRMSDYVWAIEYVGNSLISDDALTDFVQQEQICYGMKKEWIDCEEIEKKLRQKFECVAWTSIYFKGTKLYVEVKENTMQVYPMEEKQGSNLVTSQAGIIESIITRSGVPMVKKGEAVDVGQILVEGRVPIYDEALNIVEYQYCQSDADIFLRTVERYKEKLSRTGYLIDYDLPKVSRYFFSVGEITFEIPFLRQKGKPYEIVYEKKQGKLFRQIYLPLFYGQKWYRGYHLTYFDYTNEELERILFDNFEKYILCLQEKGVQIIEKNVKIDKYSNNMELVADIQVIKKMEESVAISMTEQKE